MSIILPEDDIPASAEIEGSDRLGLPLIPRANTQALAAINAIVRLLDQLVIKRTGDVVSNEMTFEDTVTFNDITAQVATLISATITNLTATNLDLDVIDANEADITTLTVATTTGTTATYTDLIATLLTAVTANIATLNSTVLIDAFKAEIEDLQADVADITTLVTNAITAAIATIEQLNADNIAAVTIEATTIKADSLDLTNSLLANGGELITSLESGPSPEPGGEGFGLALPFIPDIIDYTLHVRDTVPCLIQASWNPETDAHVFTILDTGSLVHSSSDKTGVGYPTHNGPNLYSVGISNERFIFTGNSDINFSAGADWIMTLKALRRPRLI